MEKKIKCLVVDDEPLALAQLAGYVKKVSGVQLVGECNSAAEALDIIRSTDIDVLFTDISMPDMGGMELVKLLPQTCLVIFTTAYPDYAVEGFRVDAVDYLLKPFGYHEVVAAVDKARRRLDSMPKADETARLTEDDYIFVKSDSKMSRIRIGDIMLVEGLSEYVKLYVAGESKPLTTLLSMKRTEATLPDDVFMRVHRSWIVNLKRIESVSHLRISIAGHLVPVSKSYKDTFQQYIERQLLK